jgi:hypothetical protein
MKAIVDYRGGTAIAGFHWLSSAVAVAAGVLVAAAIYT